MTATSCASGNGVPGSPVLTLRLSVKAGYEVSFVEATRDLVDAFSSHIGYLSREVIGLSDTHRDWLLIVRFECLADLDAWQSSTAYQTWLVHIESIADIYHQDVHAQESQEWIILPGRSAGLPKWKTALITVLGLYPLILWVFPQLASISNELGLTMWLGKLITVLLAVPLMTWVIVPLLMRLLGRWL